MVQIDPMMVVVAVGAIGLVVAVLAIWGMLNAQRKQSEMAGQLQAAHSELVGRLALMSEAQASSQNQMAERLQTQERVVSKALDERLGDVRKHVGDNLQQLNERLAVIDTAQKNLTDLSVQVVGLQDILSNNQARGAFGEVQLENLVTNALPPAAYKFQFTLSNGKRADCLLDLPNPPGPIVIDAKFPLGSYKDLQDAKDEASRTQASRAFTADVLKHVKDIEEKYIIRHETAESALMFLPSEAVYAELHANFVNVVEESYKRRVWIVSPTTLMATLNTVRAVLKDARMREMADVIQKQVGLLLDDAGRLGDRVEKLEKQFGTASKTIGEIKTSTNSITGRAQRIEKLELGEVEDSPVEDLEPATAQPQPALDLSN